MPASNKQHVCLHGGINLCFLFLQVEGFALQERLRPNPWARFPPLACKTLALSVKFTEDCSSPFTRGMQGFVGTMEVEGNKRQTHSCEPPSMRQSTGPLRMSHHADNHPGNMAYSKVNRGIRYRGCWLCSGEIDSRLNERRKTILFDCTIHWLTEA